MTDATVGALRLFMLIFTHTVGHWVMRCVDQLFFLATCPNVDRVALTSAGAIPSTAGVPGLAATDISAWPCS